MSAAIEQARLKIIEFRMAIFWFCLFSVNSICSAMMIALTNVTWSNLDGQAKFLIVVAIIWNWTGVIMAFISKQAGRIKSGGDLFPADTQFITRTQPVTDSVKVSQEQK